MNILLDTAAWLWMLTEPEHFSERTQLLLVSDESDLVLSAASAWEIAIKYALGKLPLPAPPADYVPRMLRQTRTRSLPIEHRHALHVTTLPPHHRDPFDRLLIAQAQLENLSLLTADEQFRKYDVELLAL